MPSTPSVPLDVLDPSSAHQDWGQLQLDRSVTGGTLRIGDRHFATGLGTHANSEIIYDLNGRYERFEAWVGVDAAMRRRTQASIVFEVSAPGLAIELSDAGEIVGARLGRGGWHEALLGETHLAGCTNAGPVTFRQLNGGGVEFAKPLVHAPSGHRARLIERFLPSKNSIRWEIEIQGKGDPWSTGIETRLGWPAAKTTRFWTAWDDPEQKHDVWRDPLVLRPLANKRLYYGAPPWQGQGPGYNPSPGLFVVPLVMVAEPKRDVALSLALSPEDPILDLSLKVLKDGLFQFTRTNHRLSRTNTVRFAMDLVEHPADWRASLGWMTRRYPQFFNPPNPRADQIAGLGAYSAWEGPLDVRRLMRMDFRVNWKASYDFPYMGMFLPPIPDSQPYTRLVKGTKTSIAQLRDYSARMRQMGFYVLNYFNVTEFGATTGMPKRADPALAPANYWENVHNFMQQVVADGILRDARGHTYGSWEGAVGMDCGAPHYRAFLLEQARRDIEKLPDSAGICIDRLDWLRFYNMHADDGISWRDGRACRSLYCSWRALLARLGPMFHAANKVIFVNALINRTDLMRQVDGIYHEFGYGPTEINGAAWQCVRKPCIAWTANQGSLKPNPDAYFQRHLYLGVYPTAPLPENDHSIQPSAWADRWYLDYGPLFNQLRGRKWVLAPHVLQVEGKAAKANLFQIPGGWLIPVCFGGTNQSANVVVRNLSSLSAQAQRFKCMVLHPGEDKPAPLNGVLRDSQLRLTVPLRRGCAMVHISVGPE